MLTINKKKAARGYPLTLNFDSSLDDYLNYNNIKEKAKSPEYFQDMVDRLKRDPNLDTVKKGRRLDVSLNSAAKPDGFSYLTKAEIDEIIDTTYHFDGDYEAKAHELQQTIEHHPTWSMMSESAKINGKLYFLVKNLEDFTSTRSGRYHR